MCKELYVLLPRCAMMWDFVLSPPPPVRFYRLSICSAPTDNLIAYAPVFISDLRLICNIQDYTTSTDRVDFDVSPFEPCNQTSTDRTIDGQTNCDYSLFSQSRTFGNSEYGGSMSTSMYVNTGSGQCSLDTNTFFLRDAGECAESEPFCSGAGSSEFCSASYISNSEIKFDLFVALNGSSMDGSADTFGGR